MSVVDPNVRTSRVFDATLNTYDKIKALETANTFPAHPVTGVRPKVHLFSDPGWKEGEYISVLINEDPAVHDWAASSPAQGDEIIIIDVLIRTMIPGQTSERAVVERLAAIAELVQLIAYDVATGKPKLIGFTNETTTGRAREVSFALQRSTHGFLGDALVRFALAARI